MKILLAVTGSVAATLTPKLAIALEELGHEIKIVATDRSLYFFNVDVEDGLSKLVHDTGNGFHTFDVYTDRDERHNRGYYYKKDRIPHVELGQWADALVIAPASANTISDIAHGRADNIVTAVTLAWESFGLLDHKLELGRPVMRRKGLKPIILAPAMNTNMWYNQIVQKNIQIVNDSYNIKVTQPQCKKLACGTEGMGAMAYIEDIAQDVEAMLFNYRAYNNS